MVAACSRRSEAPRDFHCEQGVQEVLDSIVSSADWGFGEFSDLEDPGGSRIRREDRLRYRERRNRPPRPSASVVTPGKVKRGWEGVARRKEVKCVQVVGVHTTKKQCFPNSFPSIDQRRRAS